MRCSQHQLDPGIPRCVPAVPAPRPCLLPGARRGARLGSSTCSPRAPGGHPTGSCAGPLPSAGRPWAEVGGTDPPPRGDHGRHDSPTHCRPEPAHPSVPSLPGGEKLGWGWGDPCVWGGPGPICTCQEQFLGGTAGLGAAGVTAGPAQPWGRAASLTASAAPSTGTAPSTSTAVVPAPHHIDHWHQHHSEQQRCSSAGTTLNTGTAPSIGTGTAAALALRKALSTGTAASTACPPPTPMHALHMPLAPPCPLGHPGSCWAVAQDSRTGWSWWGWQSEAALPGGKGRPPARGHRGRDGHKRVHVPSDPSRLRLLAHIPAGPAHAGTGLSAPRTPSPHTPTRASLVQIPARLHPLSPPAPRTRSCARAHIPPACRPCSCLAHSHQPDTPAVRAPGLAEVWGLRGGSGTARAQDPRG